MKPSFTMLIGIPGCGKSTWLKFNAEDSYVVNPDSIRKELSGDVSDQSINTKVWTVAKERVVDALEKGKDVVLDATNVSTYHRREFIKGLPLCYLYAKVFECDPETAYARIKKDIDAGVDRADVPQNVVFRMYAQFLQTKEVIGQERFTFL